MRKAPATSEAVAVTINRLEDVELEFDITGLTPLIPHQWSEKSKRMMPGHPLRATVAKKGDRKPEEEAEACLYRLADGRYGLPATAFKAAMVDACRLVVGGPSMVEAKILFHIVGEGADQLVPVTYGEKILREDTPRNATGTADLRYRYALTNWKATLKIRFVPTCITPESVAALLDAAGRCGVGDWRPSAPKSKTGTFGTWRLFVN